MEPKQHVLSQEGLESIATAQKQESLCSQMTLKPVTSAEPVSPLLIPQAIPDSIEAIKISSRPPTITERFDREPAEKPQSLGDAIKNLRTQKASVQEMINDIYRKERQYIPSYDKDNQLSKHSPIFELQRM